DPAQYSDQGSATMTQDEEDFQHWLDYMDDGIEEFFAMLPAQVRDRLDYSIDSLDVLEAWLLERYPNPDAAVQTSETLYLDGAARYIGETFHKIIGACWQVGAKGGLWDGWNIVTDFRTGPGESCPL